MNLPTIEEVEKIWDEWHVPENVRAHMKEVTKVAVFIAKKLKEKGINVDVGLAERSTLLHDLIRHANFENLNTKNCGSADDVEFWKQLKHKYGNMHHGDAAASVLKDKYPEVAEVIAGHTFDNVKDNILNASWEVKILVYADNRTIHNKIVSFGEKVADSKKRHGDYYDNLKKETGIDYFKINHANVKKIENEIFDIIDINPDDVNNL